jgi:uncharacterized iron-regulated membrane protein
VRKAWLQVHLWLGIGVGFFLALVGLSGALLVFGPNLARAELGSLLFPDGASASASVQTEWRPISEWVAAARSKYPELGEIEVIAAPGTTPIPSSVPMIAASVSRKASSGATRELHGVVPVDPLTSQPIGMFLAEETKLVYLTAFHASLFVPFVGQDLVAICSTIFLLSVVSGLYLWWPRDGRWRAALTYRRGSTGRLRLMSLHNVAAVWLLVPLIVVVLSGVVLLRPGWIRPALDVVSTVRDYESRAVSPSAACSRAEPTSLEQALALAQTHAPGQRWRLIVNSHEQPFIQVSLRRDGDDPRAQSTELWIDKRCPRILAARVAGSLTRGEGFLSSMMPLHASLRLGVVGSVLVFLTGVALPFLFATGLWMWLRRRRARNAGSSNEQRAAASQRG